MTNTGDYHPVKGYCNEKGIPCEYANIRGYCGLTACLKHNSVQLNNTSDFSLNFSQDSNEETGILKVKIPRAKYEFEEGGIKISVLKSE